jgi:hypothetical protein
MKGNSDHVRGHVPVDVFGFFIDVNHIPTPGDSGGQIRHGNLLKVENPHPSHPPDFRRRGGDQQESRHGWFSKPNSNRTQNFARRQAAARLPIRAGLFFRSDRNVNSILLFSATAVKLVLFLSRDPAGATPVRATCYTRLLVDDTASSDGAVRRASSCLLLLNLPFA